MDMDINLVQEILYSSFTVPSGYLCNYYTPILCQSIFYLFTGNPSFNLVVISSAT